MSITSYSPVLTNLGHIIAGILSNDPSEIPHLDSFLQHGGSLDVDLTLISAQFRHVPRLLSLAAFASADHYVTKLLSYGDKANYQFTDPIFSRTALHMACLTPHWSQSTTQVIKSLLQITPKSTSTLNLVDLYNLTPIAYIVLSPTQYSVHHFNSLKRMVNYGAISHFYAVHLPHQYAPPQFNNTNGTGGNGISMGGNSSGLHVLNHPIMAAQTPLLAKLSGTTVFQHTNLLQLVFISTHQRFSQNYQRILQHLVDNTIVHLSNQPSDTTNNNPGANIPQPRFSSFSQRHDNHPQAVQVQPHWRSKIQSNSFPAIRSLEFGYHNATLLTPLTPPNPLTTHANHPFIRSILSYAFQYMDLPLSMIQFMMSLWSDLKPYFGALHDDTSHRLFYHFLLSSSLITSQTLNIIQICFGTLLSSPISREYLVQCALQLLQQKSQLPTPFLFLLLDSLLFNIHITPNRTSHWIQARASRSHLDDTISQDNNKYCIIDPYGNNTNVNPSHPLTTIRFYPKQYSSFQTPQPSSSSSHPAGATHPGEVSSTSSAASATTTTLSTPALSRSGSARNRSVSRVRVGPTKRSEHTLDQTTTLSNTPSSRSSRSQYAQNDPDPLIGTPVATSLSMAVTPVQPTKSPKYIEMTIYNFTPFSFSPHPHSLPLPTLLPIPSKITHIFENLSHLTAQQLTAYTTVDFNSNRLKATMGLISTLRSKSPSPPIILYFATRHAHFNNWDRLDLPRMGKLSPLILLFDHYQTKSLDLGQASCIRFPPPSILSPASSSAHSPIATSSLVSPPTGTVPQQQQQHQPLAHVASEIVQIVAILLQYKVDIFARDNNKLSCIWFLLQNPYISSTDVSTILNMLHDHGYPCQLMYLDALVWLITSTKVLNPKQPTPLQPQSCLIAQLPTPVPQSISQSTINIITEEEQHNSTTNPTSITTTKHSSSAHHSSSSSPQPLSFGPITHNTALPQSPDPYDFSLIHFNQQPLPPLLLTALRQHQVLSRSQPCTLPQPIYQELSAPVQIEGAISPIISYTSLLVLIDFVLSHGVDITSTLAQLLSTGNHSQCCAAAISSVVSKSFNRTTTSAEPIEIDTNASQLQQSTASSLGDSTSSPFVQQQHYNQQDQQLPGGGSPDRERRSSKFNPDLDRIESYNAFEDDVDELGASMILISTSRNPTPTHTPTHQSHGVLGVDNPFVSPNNANNASSLSSPSPFLRSNRGAASGALPTNHSNEMDSFDLEHEKNEKETQLLMAELDLLTPQRGGINDLEFFNDSVLGNFKNAGKSPSSSISPSPLQQNANGGRNPLLSSSLSSSSSTLPQLKTGHSTDPEFHTDHQYEPNQSIPNKKSNRRLKYYFPELFSKSTIDTLNNDNFTPMTPSYTFVPNDVVPPMIKSLTIDLFSLSSHGISDSSPAIDASIFMLFLMFGSFKAHNAQGLFDTLISLGFGFQNEQTFYTTSLQDLIFTFITQSHGAIASSFGVYLLNLLTNALFSNGYSPLITTAFHSELLKAIFPPTGWSNNHKTHSPELPLTPKLHQIARDNTPTTPSSPSLRSHMYPLTQNLRDGMNTFGNVSQFVSLATPWSTKSIRNALYFERPQPRFQLIALQIYTTFFLSQQDRLFSSIQSTATRASDNAYETIKQYHYQTREQMPLILPRQSVMLLVPAETLSPLQTTRQLHHNTGTGLDCDRAADGNDDEDDTEIRFKIQKIKINPNHSTPLDTDTLSAPVRGLDGSGADYDFCTDGSDNNGDDGDDTDSDDLETRQPPIQIPSHVPFSISLLPTLLSELSVLFPEPLTEQLNIATGQNHQTKPSSLHSSSPYPPQQQQHLQHQATLITSMSSLNTLHMDPTHLKQLHTLHTNKKLSSSSSSTPNSAHLKQPLYLHPSNKTVGTSGISESSTTAHLTHAPIVNLKTESKSASSQNSSAQPVYIDLSGLIHSSEAYTSYTVEIVKKLALPYASSFVFTCCHHHTTTSIYPLLKALLEQSSNQPVTPVFIDLFSVLVQLYAIRDSTILTDLAQTDPSLIVPTDVNSFFDDESSGDDDDNFDQHSLERKYPGLFINLDPELRSLKQYAPGGSAYIDLGLVKQSHLTKHRLLSFFNQSVVGSNQSLQFSSLLKTILLFTPNLSSATHLFTQLSKLIPKHPNYRNINLTFAQNILVYQHNYTGLGGNDRSPSQLVQQFSSNPATGQEDTSGTVPSAADWVATCIDGYTNTITQNNSLLNSGSSPLAHVSTPQLTFLPFLSFCEYTTFGPKTNIFEKATISSTTGEHSKSKSKRQQPVDVTLTSNELRESLPIAAQLQLQYSPLSSNIPGMSADLGTISSTGSGSGSGSGGLFDMGLTTTATTLAAASGMTYESHQSLSTSSSSSSSQFTPILLSSPAIQTTYLPISASILEIFLSRLIFEPVTRYHIIFAEKLFSRQFKSFFSHPHYLIDHISTLNQSIITYLFNPALHLIKAIGSAASGFMNENATPTTTLVSTNSQSTQQQQQNSFPYYHTSLFFPPVLQTILAKSSRNALSPTQCNDGIPTPIAHQTTITTPETIELLNLIYRSLNVPPQQQITATFYRDIKSRFQHTLQYTSSNIPSQTTEKRSSSLWSSLFSSRPSSTSTSTISLGQLPSPSQALTIPIAHAILANTAALSLPSWFITIAGSISPAIVHFISSFLKHGFDLQDVTDITQDPSNIIVPWLQHYYHTQPLVQSGASSSSRNSNSNSNSNSSNSSSANNQIKTTISQFFPSSTVTTTQIYNSLIAQSQTTSISSKSIPRAQLIDGMVKATPSQFTLLKMFLTFLPPTPIFTPGSPAVDLLYLLLAHGAWLYPYEIMKAIYKINPLNNTSTNSPATVQGTAPPSLAASPATHVTTAASPLNAFSLPSQRRKSQSVSAAKEQQRETTTTTTTTTTLTIPTTIIEQPQSPPSHPQPHTVASPFCTNPSFQSGTGQQMSLVYSNIALPTDLLNNLPSRFNSLSDHYFIINTILFYQHFALSPCNKYPSAVVALANHPNDRVRQVLFGKTTFVFAEMQCFNLLSLSSCLSNREWVLATNNANITTVLPGSSSNAPRKAIVPSPQTPSGGITNDAFLYVKQQTTRREEDKVNQDKALSSMASGSTPDVTEQQSQDNIPSSFHINFSLIDNIPNTSDHSQSEVDGTIGLFWYLINYSMVSEADITTFLTESRINPTLGMRSVSLDRLTPRGESILMHAILRSAGGYRLATTHHYHGKLSSSQTSATPSMDSPLSTDLSQQQQYTGQVWTENMLFKLLVHLGIEQALLHTDRFGRGIRDYLYFCNTHHYAPNFVNFVEMYLTALDRKNQRLASRPSTPKSQQQHPQHQSPTHNHLQEEGKDDQVAISK